MMNKDEIELFETTDGKVTNVLWEYLAKGCVIDRKRMRQLGHAVEVMTF